MATKAAIVVLMEVEDDDYEAPAEPLAEMLDAIREVLGTDRENVTVYGAIKEKADEVEALFEDTP